MTHATASRAATDSQRTILLTGATGLLGSEVLYHYLANAPEVRVEALIRGESDDEVETRLEALLHEDHPTLSEPPAALRQRVEAVRGDVTQEDLGLTRAVRERLTDQITDVIHSAAAVSFTLPLEKARAVNFHGTQHVLDLARDCRRLQRVAHVSTAHVAGRRSGSIAEDELEHDADFVNSYEQSKYEAERYVRSVMDELPVAVYRFTTMIGDSRTSRVRQFNFFHQALRVFNTGVVPVIPGDPDGHIDLIPTDYSAAALAHLFDEAFSPGTTYHLCAGPEKSFVLRELLDATYDIFRAYRPAGEAAELQKPRIVDWETFEGMARLARQAGGNRLGHVLGAIEHFIPHLSLPKVFDDTNARRDLAGGGIEPPDVRTYYRDVVRYCLESNWGKKTDRSQQVLQTTE